ncbi:hypothetical protein [Clostridium botulinum]|uniref:hypothetical protein n=1 Tax=Clostridium botulinum TaxID=1491 RepID=UPI0030D2700B
MNFSKKLICQKMRAIVDHNDLKIFALNWIFKNVEVVKEAPEIPAQEQYEFTPSTSEGICTGELCRKPD